MPGGLSRAEARLARFKKKQAELPEHEKLHNRNDLSQKSDRQLSVVTLSSYQAAKRWFLEYTQSQHPDIDGESFFQPGGPAPEIKLIKSYAVFLAQSRVGQLNDKLSLFSIAHYIRVVLSVIRRDRQSSFLTPEERLDISNFVKHDLAEQEDLSTEVYEKGVAHSEDMTFLISVLLAPSYIGTFMDMRTVLNMLLFMNLVVDSCGRGGDIAQNSSQAAGVHLKWEDIKFYAFPLADGVDLTARITFKWMKGMTNDESQFKIIPYELLSTNMAAQDTLRLLLITALLDKVIEGVDSWEDLMRAQPAESGSLIRIKADALTLPVLRQISAHRVIDSPVRSSDLQGQVRRLGTSAGLEQRLTTYCLRRGVAYMLQTKTSRENRKFLMGHKTTSRAYSAYHSTVSTIDFVSIFRKLDARPMDRLLGMQLNRSDSAPQQLSAQGFDIVTQDPEYRRLDETAERIRAQIVEKYDSLAAASRNGDPLFDEYRCADNTRKQALKTLSITEYKKEYARHFATISCNPTSYLIDAVDLDDFESQDDDDDYSEASDDFLSDVAIDPALLEDEPREKSLLLTMVDQMLGEEPFEAATDEMVDDVEVIDNDDSPDMRRHGVPTHLERIQQVGNSEVKMRLSNRGRARHFVGTGLCDNLPHVLTCGMSEGDLAREAVEMFSIRHTHDAYYHGEEPFPGTYECRFCGTNLAGVSHPTRHVHSCARIEAIDQATLIMDVEFPFNRPCEYQACGSRDTLGQFVMCRETFEDRVSFYEHFRDHLRAMRKTLPDKTKVLSCFFGDCATNPEDGRLRRGGPSFLTEEDQLEHLKISHRLVMKKGIAVEFCEMCHEWNLEIIDNVDHTHYDEVAEIIHRLGYTGISGSSQLVPRFCIFCFHDNLKVDREKAFQYSREGWVVHIRAHLDAMKEAMVCPAYPALCTKSTKMDQDGMERHLGIVHLINVAARSRGKTTKSTASIPGSEEVEAGEQVPAPRMAAKSENKSLPRNNRESRSGTESTMSNLESNMRTDDKTVRIKRKVMHPLSENKRSHKH